MQPTAANYLGHVANVAIVETFRKDASEQAEAQLADLKKLAMAEAAERVLADTGWLLRVLCIAQTAAG
ncbi:MULTISPECIES: hypothetical protein [unclassified Bradyrhizobium]|uniref:hypothetical protein n=1 Tax=unclassified Bradyrhizobium TaxID=2631580 RepID=UPI001CD31051|nr:MULTISPECIES: hypothetical protein [unclassified Bradyrhizobium]MCA1373582.1 hypothetical protein [Bradyrhizobium sp. IC4060]MCA1487225.1 hypothetical protein [Bradyrhizobium sp. IC4061]